MRRLLFSVLILLVPLRTWAGDMMALQMLSPHQDATTFIANHAENTWASATFDSEAAAQPHHDCPGHAEVAGDPGTVAGTEGNIESVASPANASHGDCKTCSHCQICHTVAVEPSVNPMPVIAFAHHAQPRVAHTPFASAVLAPGLKPPIS
jgi:hypothetical protein